jgi:aminopeptidase YwaD
MLANKKTKGLALVLVFIFMTSLAVSADLVSKQEILDEISADKIMRHIEILAAKDDARIAGSDGEREAADYIEKLFREEFGLDQVERAEFDTLLYHDNGATFQINTPMDIELTDSGALNMEFSTNGTVSGELVFVGLGTLEECTAANVAGKVALIKRGEFTFSEKVQNAANAGAIGAILFNNIMEEGFINGTLGEESDIPAIEIHPVNGEMLAELIQRTSVNITMTANGEIEPVTSQNVIGTLYAKEQKNNTPTIVIGAHYDCVDTPGANDNASGTATMLEVARVFSKGRYDANIKFIAFGAEEVGLVGAYDFVEHLDKNQKMKMAAMINMDMVGVGDKFAIWTIGDKASATIADLAETYVQKRSFSYNPPSVEDRSDHAAFAENGIPAVYFSYEVDHNYHTDQDIINYIDKENVENVSKIVAEMAYDMAETPMLQSTQGFHGTVNKYRHINPNKLQK